MNNKERQLVIVEHLRKLADNIESGKSNVVSLSLEDHYETCFHVEENLYRHTETGDKMIVIRFKA